MWRLRLGLHQPQWWRWNKAAPYQNTLRAAVSLHAVARGSLAHKDGSRRASCPTRIQTQWLGWSAGKHYQGALRAVVPFHAVACAGLVRMGARLRALATARSHSQAVTTAVVTIFLRPSGGCYPVSSSNTIDSALVDRFVLARRGASFLR